MIKLLPSAGCLAPASLLSRLTFERPVSLECDSINKRWLKSPQSQQSEDCRCFWTGCLCLDIHNNKQCLRQAKQTNKIKRLGGPCHSLPPLTPPLTRPEHLQPWQGH
ncbi:hypothetical protein MHYP_G00039340 [Metynnis hypsauchen]